ncbi:MAG: glycosyltransferase family 2 protein [Victivallales bacterium]|nr:glycosyltransferase family 2 protein [Victivallales bacterium]
MAPLKKMSTNLKISVITVCYNSAAYLEKAVESVLSQNYDNFEYLIIDGGSTDGTPDIIRRYEDRLAYWTSEPDRGIYDAMNKGIARASGDIVGIINSDDYYFPEALQKVADAFEGKSLDEYIFWGDVQYEHRGRVRGFRPAKVKTGAFAPHPSMFCPRRIYERIGTYDASFRLLGDYDFMYRAVNKFNLKPLYVPELIAFFREGGLADSNILSCLRDELKVKRRYGQPWFIAYPVFFLKILKNAPRILNNRGFRL